MSIQTGSPSFWQDLSLEDLAHVLGTLERRRYDAGATLLVEGETPESLFIVESGTADIFVADTTGAEQLVSRAGPGVALGEMSLFTGQPAAATVRARTPLQVVALSRDDFARLAAAFPRIYQTLGAIMAEKLVRTDRRSLHATRRLSVLADRGAPPLLAYALACAVAWHGRRSTLLVALADTPAPDLAALAERPPGGAHLLLARLEGAFAPETLAATVENLRARYDHVLIVAADTLPALDAPVLYLGAGEGPRQEGGVIVRAWSTAGAGPRPDQSGVLHVPPLAPEDEEAVRVGILPPTTPAGAALGWSARHLTGLKVGLALGAGSTMGYAHFGVLRALTRLGVPIDYLAGASIGAAVASSYALGHSLDEGIERLGAAGDAAWRPTAPFAGLLSTAGLRRELQRGCGERRIEDLAPPLAVVAADIASQEEIVFRRGLLWPRLLASMAIPGIFPPVKLGAHVLVDGGVLNPVPSDVVSAMGADVVLAVRLTSRPLRRAQGARPFRPSLMRTMTRSLEIMMSTMSTKAAAPATIVIEPDFGGVQSVGLRGFSQARAHVPLGEAAVEAALPRLAAVLPWMR